MIYDAPRLQKEPLKFAAVDADGPLSDPDGRQFPALDEHVRSRSRDLELSRRFGYGQSSLFCRGIHAVLLARRVFHAVTLRASVFTQDKARKKQQKVTLVAK